MADFYHKQQSRATASLPPAAAGQASHLHNFTYIMCKQPLCGGGACRLCVLLCASTLVRCTSRRKESLWSVQGARAASQVRFICHCRQYNLLLVLLWRLPPPPSLICWFLYLVQRTIHGVVSSKGWWYSDILIFDILLIFYVFCSDLCHGRERRTSVLLCYPAVLWPVTCDLPTRIKAKRPSQKSSLSRERLLRERNPATRSRLAIT